jgi:chemotaxis protein CheD
VTVAETTTKRLVLTEADPDRILIGVGELATGQHPQVLVTQALGSCVGVTLWDPRTRVGGMAHVMLPASGHSTAPGRATRFADLAVPALVDLLTDLGSPKRRLIAKIAGGSAMFTGDSMGSIGARNAAAVVDHLEQLGLLVQASDCGGSHARTIELHLETGVLVVRSYVYGIKEI